MRAATTASVETALPDWVFRLRAEGGEGRPWITVADALPYLPMPRNRAYRACDRYLERIERERKRRHSDLVPMDSIYARDGELPCKRVGRSKVLIKWLLERQLLGFEP